MRTTTDYLVFVDSASENWHTQQVPRISCLRWIGSIRVIQISRIQKQARVRGRLRGPRMARIRSACRNRAIALCRRLPILLVLPGPTTQKRNLVRLLSLLPTLESDKSLLHPTSERNGFRPIECDRLPIPGVHFRFLILWKGSSCDVTFTFGSFTVSTCVR